MHASRKRCPSKLWRAKCGPRAHTECRYWTPRMSCRNMVRASSSLNGPCVFTASSSSPPAAAAASA